MAQPRPAPATSTAPPLICTASAGVHASTIAPAGGIPGAAVAATAAFLPSFVIMLVILPARDRVRKLAWMRAVMKGIGPAVIGVLAVSLIRLAPAALPDPFAVVIFAATFIALIVFRTSAFKLMIAGAILGVLKSRLPAIPAFKAAEYLIKWTV